MTKKLGRGSLPKGRRFVRVGQGEPLNPRSAPPPPPRGKNPRRRRWGILFVLVLILPLLTLGGVGAWMYQRDVVEYQGPEMEKQAILAAIAQESPVYYRGGTERMGVFFDAEHRRYVRYADLPQDWVHAIIAAEDGHFFQHPGIDPKHILRAAWQNFQAGKVIAGGSTLTQQTAKNLFYRPDRSFRSKWTELLNALRLEQRYSKEEILEFYANQFHVSANGRGLGIAARYFFDKDPSALNLKECAFIAGMVKAPSRYNPFIGGSPERRAEATQAAEDRTSYVLRRMQEEGYIDAATLQQNLATPLNFHRGTFQYDRSVLLDSVEGVLEKTAFVELFEKLGIDNPATAGISVVTTLDPVVQREATYALWHHLTQIGPMIERLGAHALLLPNDALPPPVTGEPLLVHGFYPGKVVSASSEGVQLDLSGRACTVDSKALQRMGAILAQARSGNANAESDDAALSAIQHELDVGKVVLASVIATTPSAQCDLEIRPKMQGAVVVLDQGKVLALVGGNDNRNFDRATTAERQLGSTWKPLIYYAALHLGWLPDDPLDNRRNAFPFRGVWYYPHPDHPSDPFVTMSLSGARSENLASVWLLYHMVDRLDAAQFKQLATEVGLWPAANDSTWATRMRDTEGLRSSPDRFEEYAFTLAKQDVMAALPYPEDALVLRSMLHGAGAAAELARVQSTEDATEKAARIEALSGSLLALEEQVSTCRNDPTQLWDQISTGSVACGRSPGDGWVRRATPEDLAPEPETTPEAGTPAEPTSDIPLAPDTLVAGRIHLGTLDALRAAVERRQAELSGRDPWDPEVLALSPDFRVLVGLRWVQKLAKSLGVRSELPTVLSLPLGAADITLEEAASIYQGFLRGEHWVFGNEGFVEGEVSGLRSALSLPELDVGALLVSEVRDTQGNVIYRATPRPEPVGDPLSGELVGDILRNVVRVGTGRRALDAVHVGDQALILAGKTGTTNDYRNAAFVGFVPKNTDGKSTWGDGYTVAVYVGYDDNRSMRRGNYRVQGANGALPVWMGVASGLNEAGLIGALPLGAATEFLPSPELEVRMVQPGTGLPRTEGEGPTTLSTQAGLRHYALPGTPPVERPVTTEQPPAEMPPPLPEQDLAPEEGVDVSSPVPATEL